MAYSRSNEYEADDSGWTIMKNTGYVIYFNVSIELFKSWLSLYVSVPMCLSWLPYQGLAPILSSGALESQCRSGLFLSYPTIYKITSINHNQHTNIHHNNNIIITYNNITDRYNRVGMITFFEKLLLQEDTQVCVYVCMYVCMYVCLGLSLSLSPNLGLMSLSISLYW